MLVVPVLTGNDQQGAAGGTSQGAVARRGVHAGGACRGGGGVRRGGVACAVGVVRPAHRIVRFAKHGCGLCLFGGWKPGMRGLSYGAVVGGMLGVFFGWAPAFFTVVFIPLEDTRLDLPFGWMFLGLWTAIAVFAATGGAGIGYVVGRRVEDE